MNLNVVPDNANSSTQAITVGAGYREKNYFLDFAYQNLQSVFFYLPYVVSGSKSNSGSNISVFSGLLFFYIVYRTLTSPKTEKVLFARESIES